MLKISYLAHVMMLPCRLLLGTLFPHMLLLLHIYTVARDSGLDTVIPTYWLLFGRYSALPS